MCLRVFLGVDIPQQIKRACFFRRTEQCKSYFPEMTLQFEMYTRLFHLGYAKGATSKTNSHEKIAALHCRSSSRIDRKVFFCKVTEKGVRQNRVKELSHCSSLFCRSTLCWHVASDRNCAEHGFWRFEWLGPSDGSHGLIYWLGLGHPGHMLRIRNFEKPRVLTATFAP